ncbi:MAG: hypothetical protein Q9160_000918 [Pyrenula sp. 1 TL-2023]
MAQYFPGRVHEQNAKWTAVDNYAQSHLHPSSRPYHAPLENVLKNSLASGLPDISSYPVLAKFFALQCTALGVKHALEIGTLGGYTAIWLAKLNPGLKVTTIDVDPKHVAVARENARNAGIEEGRIEFLQGPALDVLPGVREEIAQGKREKFGFVWIDADKVNNWKYFDLIVSGGLALPRTVIYVDNIARRGNLPKRPEELKLGVDEDNEEDLEDNREGLRGAREVVENVGKDDRVEGVVLQTVGEKSYDGFLFAVVKG